MKALLSVFSKTVKGGIFFLLPIVIIVFLLGKAFRTVTPVAETLQEKVPGDFPFLALTISLLILLFICFLAGWLAGKGLGKAVISWLENNLLILFPGYQLMKSTMETKVGSISEKEFPVVLVPGDGWVFGFLVEELPNQEVVVFLPSAPSVWEGSLIIIEKSQLRQTELKQADVLTLMKKLGVGTSDLLNAVIKK